MANANAILELATVDIRGISASRRGGISPAIRSSAIDMIDQDQDTGIIPIVGYRGATGEVQATRMLNMQMPMTLQKTVRAMRNPLDEPVRATRPKPVLRTTEEKKSRKHKRSAEDALIHKNPLATPEELMGILGMGK